MLKKYGILLPYSNFQCLHHSRPISKTSLPHRSSVSQQQSRHYAMVSDGPVRHNHGNLRWPEVTSANTIPSPYQIFNQKKGSPYSKQRFYELVKLYHPDRQFDSLHDELSENTKLERYRLVVAANNILSDPVKRGAYDLYGAGWNGQPDVARDRSEDGRGWGSSPNGPSQNATWEDWEKWYQREAEGPQEPRFVSNGAFVGLIVIFAVLGGIGQAARVGNYSINFLEQSDALHDSASKDLMRRRREASSFDNREERIHTFLRQRDPVGYGVTNPRDESYRKLLPAPEVCSSEDIKGRPMDIYQPKSNPKG
ncbi:J domain-containing protein 1 [Lachnellula cervina]|uniref:J domain-containing protein 1 n=1 Tax=Lachnellula cervina TaxID=1316786 RepID=A0A7D8UWD4_9HELO|nr:J domain-containing protein 1 [Lachnellula cervina]